MLCAKPAPYAMTPVAAPSVASGDSSICRPNIGRAACHDFPVFAERQYAQERTSVQRTPPFMQAAGGTPPRRMILPSQHVLQRLEITRDSLLEPAGDEHRTAPAS